jgi:uncharacterized protein
MPITPTYPGVYIEEIPSGVRTIVGVATSVTAFIDFFKQGPINRAIQIFNMGDFERVFGGLDTRSEASYSIQQFFLNGGSEAWIVRTAAGGYAAASVVLQDTPGGNSVLRVSAGQRIRGVSVDNPGDWGNSLRIDVDYDTTDPTTRFNLTVSQVAERNNRLIVLQSEAFRNLTMVAGPDNAIEVVNEGSKLIQLSRQSSWPLNRPAQTGTSGGTLGTLPTSGSQFQINYSGGSATATISSSPANAQQLRAAIETAIRAAGSPPNPLNPLLAEATVQLIGNQLRILAGGRTNRDFNREEILTFSEVGAGTTAANLGLVGAGVVANIQQYSVGIGSAVGAQSNLVLGADGDPPGATELRGSRLSKSGLYALEDVDIFNILCIPRAAELSDTEMATVISEATDYCENRLAFLIIDIPPRINEVQEVKDWLAQNDTLRHRNTAVYFPRPRIADPLNGFRLRSIGASGTIAGLYARIDVTRGVWKAPAGIEATLINVQELDYKLTDPENGTLNPLGINCLRNFPVYGNVCWGARTLLGADQLASEWKYVPIRRLTLFIEQSLYRGTKWVVFEPNDEPLWAQIRLNIGAFMNGLFRQGAFQGSTPDKAFFVKCDSETTTQADRNLGIVNIEVGFAPLKPAEFVIIKIQQIAGDLQ